MKATRCGWRLYLFVALGLLLVSMLLAGCGRPATVNAQIRRNLSNVYAGEGSPDSLPLLSDDDWHELRDMSLITTDADGEGWLQINQCMLVYIFQNSGLVKAACPKSDLASGNVTCALEGTSAYNNDCSDKIVIQTLSAEVVLEGTWISITYLPEQQVTILSVFEGHATARPVRNAELRTMGEAIEIPTRHFWFSEPGITADPIAGLAAREPHPFDQLPLLIEKLHLESWVERLRVRAADDNVPFPDFATPAETPSPTPTVPPTPTRTATPTPRPVIRFWADPTSITAGERTTLRWQIENVRGAFLSGGNIKERAAPGPSGSLGVSPAATTTYTLRVILLSGRQETHTARVTVKPRTNFPPKVTITTPDKDAEYWYDGYDQQRQLWYTDVTLTGSASDPEDGVLKDPSLVWTTNLTDIQKALLGAGRKVTVRLYSNVCEGVRHTITLTAADSDGNRRTDSRGIFIRTIC
ncbi:MAG TPA: hypothetical protein DEP84_20830 [Chloroflexi bacterium]|nr:hypothetical protein [Chloroflexota bacterium]